MKFIVCIMCEGTNITMPFTVKEVGEVNEIDEGEKLIKIEAKKMKVKTGRSYIGKIWPVLYVEKRLEKRKQLFIENNKRIGRTEVFSNRVWDLTLAKLERQRVLTGQFSDTERLDFIEKHFLQEIDDVRSLVDEMLFTNFLKQTVGVTDD